MLVALVAAVLAALFFFVLVPRMNELFLVSVRDGQVLLVRGRAPVRLLNDFADVVRRAKVARGTIRAVREQGHSRLVTGGMDENVTQRLRNAFGAHPVQKLQAAPPVDRRNIGQVLGIAWLAWVLMPRD